MIIAEIAEMTWNKIFLGMQNSLYQLENLISLNNSLLLISYADLT